MRNKNNPLGSLHQSVPGFRRSEFSRGNKVTQSMSIGGFFPVDNYDIISGSYCKLRLNTKLDSFPAISPLYGTIKLRYDVFFCPYRNYIPNLTNNNINDVGDIDEFPFPRLQYVPSSLPNEGYQITHYEYLKNPGMEPDGTYDYSTVVASDPSTVVAGVVPYGSVLHYLNYPQMGVSLDGVSYNEGEEQLSMLLDFNMTNRDYYDRLSVGYYHQESPWNYVVRTPDRFNSNDYHFNLIPWLAYIDAYRMYVANPQDDVIPLQSYVIKNPSGDIDTSLVGPYTDDLTIKDLDNIISLFRDTNDRHSAVTHDSYNIKWNGSAYYYHIFDNVLSPNSSVNRVWNPFGVAVTADQYFLTQNGESYTDLPDSWREKFYNFSMNSYAHLGILPSTYLPDYFNSGIDYEKYNTSRVALSSSLYADQLRLKEREWLFNVRNLFSSRRYTDYNYLNYMSELKLNDYPIYLGGDTINFSFQDILSQSNSGGNEITDHVGGTAAKASFDTQFFNDKFKPIKFTARENGLLLICARLVPEVDYSRGVPRFMLKTFWKDLYKPIYDGVGFDDMFAQELDAGVDNPRQTTWKMPLGWEYMKSSNKVHGLFATDSFRSWTLQRLDTRDVVQDGTDFNIYPNPTTYIIPEQFNYPFVTAGNDNDNFGFKIDIDLEVVQPLSKSVINMTTF